MQGIWEDWRDVYSSTFRSFIECTDRRDRGDESRKLIPINEKTSWQDLLPPHKLEIDSHLETGNVDADNQSS